MEIADALYGCQHARRRRHPGDQPAAAGARVRLTPALRVGPVRAVGELRSSARLGDVMDSNRVIIVGRRRGRRRRRRPLLLVAAACARRRSAAPRARHAPRAQAGTGRRRCGQDGPSARRGDHRRRRRTSAPRSSQSLRPPTAREAAAVGRPAGPAARPAGPLAVARSARRCSTCCPATALDDAGLGGDRGHPDHRRHGRRARPAQLVERAAHRGQGVRHPRPRPRSGRCCGTDLLAQIGARPGPDAAHQAARRPARRRARRRRQRHRQDHDRAASWPAR